MLVRDGGVVDLIDVAAADGEILATAVDLHRIAVARGVVAAESDLALDRASDPTKLAVRNGKVARRAATDAVRTAILDAEVIDRNIVRGLEDVALDEQLDRRETLRWVALRRAEIDALLILVVVVELQVAP